MQCINEFRDEFTAEMDTHLRRVSNGLPRNDTIKTYIDVSRPTRKKYECSGHPEIWIIDIRYDGVDRGAIMMDRDTGKVLDIDIWDAAYPKVGKTDKKISCYESSVVEVALKWKGHIMKNLHECISLLPYDGLEALGPGVEKCGNIIEYTNEFTKDLDEHLKSSWKRMLNYSSGSYIYLDYPAQSKYECENFPDLFIVVFRFPGATRGHIVMRRDTGIVDGIRLYDTAYTRPGKLSTGITCYMPSVIKVIDKWIGKPMKDLHTYLTDLPLE